VAAFFPAAPFNTITASTNLRESNHLDFLHRREVSHIPRHQSKTLDPGGGSNDRITKMSPQIWIPCQQIGKGGRDFLVGVYLAESLQEPNETVSLTATEKWM
jgi:hypothetical protein